jgi:hypothetical protein
MALHWQQKNHLKSTDTLVGGKNEYSASKKWSNYTSDEKEAQQFTFEIDGDSSWPTSEGWVATIKGPAAGVEQTFISTKSGNTGQWSRFWISSSWTDFERNSDKNYVDLQADHIAQQFGYTDYDDMNSNLDLSTPFVSNKYIRSGLIDVDDLLSIKAKVTNTLTIGDKNDAGTLKSYDKSWKLKKNHFKFGGGILQGDSSALTLNSGGGYKSADTFLDTDTNKFSIGADLYAKNGDLHVDKITAKSGTVGGFDIASSTLKGKNNSGFKTDGIYANSQDNKFSLGKDFYYKKGDGLHVKKLDGATGSLGDLGVLGTLTLGSESQDGEIKDYEEAWDLKKNHFKFGGGILKGDKNGLRFAGFEAEMKSLRSITTKNNVTHGMEINAGDKPYLGIIAGGDEVFIGSNFDFNDQQDISISNIDWAPPLTGGSVDLQYNPQHIDRSFDYPISSNTNRIFKVDFNYDLTAYAQQDVDIYKVTLKVYLQFFDGSTKIDQTTITKAALADNVHGNAENKGSSFISNIIPNNCDKVRLRYTMDITVWGNGDASGSISFYSNATIIGNERFISPLGFKFTSRDGSHTILGDREKGLFQANKLKGNQLQVTDGNRSAHFMIYNGHVVLVDDNGHILDSWTPY